MIWLQGYDIHYQPEIITSGVNKQRTKNQLFSLVNKSESDCIYKLPHDLESKTLITFGSKMIINI